MRCINVVLTYLLTYETHKISDKKLQKRARLWKTYYMDTHLKLDQFIMQQQNKIHKNYVAIAMFHC